MKEKNSFSWFVAFILVSITTFSGFYVVFKNRLESNYIEPTTKLKGELPKDFTVSLSLLVKNKNYYLQLLNKKLETKVSVFQTPVKEKYQNLKADQLLEKVKEYKAFNKTSPNLAKDTLTFVSSEFDAKRADNIKVETTRSNLALATFKIKEVYYLVTVINSDQKQTAIVAVRYIGPVVVDDSLNELIGILG
jgi:hypothetical protein